MIIVKQQENFVEIKFHTFSGGEEHVNVVLPSPAIVSSSVEILARIDSSSELMRLLLVTDALKRLGIKTIELVLPYIPYARQDRVCNLGDSFSLKIFANLINAQGYSRVHVTDAHSTVATALLDNVVERAQSTFAFPLASRLRILGLANYSYIVAPDAGASKKAVDFARGYNLSAKYVANDCLDSIKNYMLNDIESEIRNDTPHGECGEDIVTRIYKAGDKYYKAKVEIEWNRYDKQYYYVDNSRVLEFEEVELSPEQKGLIECLWDIFGGTLTEKGYKVLDTHIGAIYGDSITYKRAEEIFRRLTAKGFASSNVVLGIGSYSFQYVTRDTHSHAMKSTYAEINGAGVEIFKDPKTDNGTKKSAKGLLMVTQTDGVYKLVDQVSVDQERHGCLETVFKDGQLVKTTTLAEIRAITDKV
jgi:phosphoribosylpyrophosphate synthetase